MIVPGRGNKNAELAFIGEAPGAEEIKCLQPFRGPSGKMLDNLLGHNGIAERDIFVDNVCQSPPSGRNPSQAEIIQAIPDLRNRLRNLPNLNCIVAVGNVALQALSVFQFNGITKYRGSVLPVRLLGKEKNVKMVPIVHPSFIMQNGNYEFRYFHVSIGDIEKAKQEVETKGIIRPLRNHRIIYNFDEAVSCLRTLRGNKDIPFSFDVETSLPCLGFAQDIYSSFTIPFESITYPHIWPSNQRQYLIEEVRKVFDKDAKVITQNGFFDKRVLWKDYGIDPNSWRIHADTMHMHQLLYSELPHSLAFITSVYTKEPYYKDEGYSFDRKRAGPRDEHRYFTYNGKDCCVTLESWQQMEAELDEIGHGQKDYFYSVLMPALQVLFRMHTNGVFINTENHARAVKQLKRAETIERIRLINSSGQEPNTRAPTEMEPFLIGLGIKSKDLPRTPKTNQIQLTEDIFDRLYAKYGFPSLASIIRLRKNLFLQSGFTKITTDIDGRYRIVFKLGPKSGRLASEGEDKGPQLQNIPAVQKGKPNLRSPYGASEGRVLISGDLEAADTRSLAYYAPELTFIKIFEGSDTDIHSQVACEIFGLEREKVSKNGPHAKERSVSKVVGHGSNYGMGPRRVVNTLRENGIFISEADAKRFQTAYFARFSGIKPYHISIQKQIRSTRAVFDLTGRRHVFLGFIDDKLFQEAYSRPPQATVAGVMLKGMIALQEEIDKYDWEGKDPLIIIQVHDELIIECQEEHTLFVANIIQQTMEIPLTAHERTFKIPMAINVGKDWGNMCPLEQAGLVNTSFTRPKTKLQTFITSGAQLQSSHMS